VAQSARSDADGDTVSVDRIAAADLFGEKPAEQATQEKVIDAPETQLDLTLTGIIASGDESRSWALIEKGGEDQKPYAVGNTISNNVELHAIYSNRVILDRSGRFETLTLEREKTDGGLRSVERRSAGGGGDGDVADRLSQAREQILADPSKITEYVRLQPEKRDGRLVGYRVYPGRNRELFQKVGLRPGELVIAVNGTQLDNQSQALRTLGDLSQASSATLTVQRGGQTRTVTLSFN